MTTPFEVGFQGLLFESEVPTKAIITSFFLQGSFLVMGIYMILLYIQNRKRDYLLYAIYLLVFTFYFFIRIDAVIKLDLFSENRTYYYHLLTPLLLTITGIYVIFISVFAEIKKYDRRFAKHLDVFAIVLFIVALSVLTYTLVTNDFQGVQDNKRYILVPMHLFTLFALIKAYFVIKSNIRHYVVWANVFLFVFSILGVYFSKNSTLLEDIYSNRLYGFYPFNASQLGTFLEMVCFSLGLGYKFSLVEKEKDEVKQKYISQLRENEIVTKKLNQELTNLVSQRTSELEAKTLLLEKEQAVKARFFENISHEFRTPLTLIKSPVEEAIRTKNKIPDRHIEVIAKNANKLTTLINDLLALSKIESGKFGLSKSKQNPVEQTVAIASQFSSLAEDRNLSYSVISPEENFSAFYDKSVVEKVLVNLISNSIKYTEAGGSVSVEIKLEESSLILIVKDDGLGIPSKDLSRVFDRFYQTSNNTLDVTGTGIGLALVKELLEIHGGKVNVVSKEHKGSTFSAVIPLENLTILKGAIQNSMAPQEPIQKLEQSEHTSKSIEKPALLLVEDNIDLQVYLKDILCTLYDITVTDNGSMGIKLAIKNVPDLIVSDVMMPKKNGFELCEILKTDKRTSHIPIILLTAKGGEENEITGLTNGADAYITKPFDIRKLLIRIEKLIVIRKQIQEHYSKHLSLKPKSIMLSPTDEAFFTRIQSILDEYLYNPEFSALRFSKLAHMSRMQLHRKLLAYTGLSTTAFIRSQRLKQAVELLKTSDTSINEIAYAVGFSSPSYFIKCFKEVYHKTPKDYFQSYDNQ